MSDNGEYGRRDYPVTIIIRAWLKHEGAVEQTVKCLESIEANTDRGMYRSILVSNECDSEDFESLVDAVDTLIKHEDNYGAVRATNDGLQLAMLDGSEYILVLDNDTEIPEGDTKWLERWLCHFEGESNESVGAVGATSDYTSGWQNVEHTPRTYTKEVENSNEGGPGFPGPVDSPFLISFACMYKKQSLRRAIPPWVTGQDLGVLRRTDPSKHMFLMGQMIKEGYPPIAYLFDERFTPGNWEDIDISLRLSLAGYTLRVARDLYIHHVGSQSFQKLEFNELLQENMKKGLEKWGADVLESHGLIHQVAQ